MVDIRTNTLHAYLYPESAAKAEEKMWLVDAHCTAKNDDLSLHYI